VALDTVYTAETPEGIALSLRPAGIVPRLQAYLVDCALRIVIYILLSLCAIPFGGLGAALLLVAYFLLEWFYPVWFELGREGATPGKRMFGLAVRMDSGLPVTPAASITRNLLRAADFLPVVYGFAVVSMLARKDFKRLGDLAAGTLVVHTATVGLHGAPPEAAPAAPARALSAREQAAVVAWAMRVGTLTPERLEELAQLAVPVIAPAHQPLPRGAQATPALLGVAQWLLGRRQGDGSPP
jgi:uncharacterized RDD family membrane protein YckC